MVIRLGRSRAYQTKFPHATHQMLNGELFFLPFIIHVNFVSSNYGGTHSSIASSLLKLKCEQLMRMSVCPKQLSDTGDDDDDGAGAILDCPSSPAFLCIQKMHHHHSLRNLCTLSGASING